MRIELSRPKKADAKKPDVVLTKEEREALEIEKAQLLEALSPQRKPAGVTLEFGVKRTERTEPAPVAPREEVPAPEPALEIPDVAGITAERKQIEADLKALEAQLTAAKLREKQAQQAAIVAQQQQTQAQGTRQLAPLQPLLQRHLAEVVRIQAQWGPTLKDYARSMPSDSDPQVRRKIGEVYAAAAPLGQKLGDARATLESAIKGLSLAMQSPQAHVHAQAATLAEAALSINIITLEGEIKSLVQLRNELRPGYVVQSTTANHITAPSLAPRAHIVSADFGPSLT